MLLKKTILLVFFLILMQVPAIAEIWTRTGPYGPNYDVEINAIAIDPMNPETIYIGTENHYLYKSINGGANWTQFNYQNGSLTDGIYALAIDPINTSTIYAGGFNRVCKSTNGDSAWTAVNLNNPVNAIAIDPKNPDTIYAGIWSVSFNQDAVYKSSDGGATWTSNNLSFLNSTVYAIAIDPVNTSTLYVGTSGSYLYKTTNGGMNWTQLSNYNGLGSNYVFALAIDPMTSGTVYAGTYCGLYKSTNGGLNWTAVNSGPAGYKVLTIAIDPKNPDTIYAGTDNSIYKSTNGGLNWTAINSGLSGYKVLTIAIDPDITNTLYVGTDSGVFKTVNSDLVITSMSNPPAVKDARGSFNIKTVVRNEGALKTAKSSIRYYLSLDTTKDDNDILLKGKGVIPTLGENKKLKITTRVTVPKTMQPNIYYSIACADVKNTVNESNEDNNCTTSLTTIEIR